VDGKHATVKWKIGTLRMTAAIEYRLRLQNARWRIFDVLLNGQSFIASCRQELDQKIRASSYTAVVRDMPRWESLAFMGPGLTLAPTADSFEPVRRAW
jgi:ABC-type transporter MlaC component